MLDQIIPTFNEKSYDKTALLAISAISKDNLFEAEELIKQARQEIVADLVTAVG